MICKICNITISDHAAFCPVCGTETGAVSGSKPATKTCPQCGAENPLNAKFCRNDGFNFPQPEPEAVPPVEETKAEGIKCPVCGTLNPESASFCRKDGIQLKPDNLTDKKIEDKKIEEKKVEEKKVDTSVEKESVSKEPEKNAKGFRNKKVWIYLTALLIFSFVAAYWLFSGPVTSKQTQTTSGDTEEARPAEQTPEQKNGAVTEKRNKTMDSEHVKGPDLARLEGQINRALRKEGLEGVTAEVDDSAVVTLKGVVKDPDDKKEAFEIARAFKGVRQVKDIIFVIER